MYCKFKVLTAFNFDFTLINVAFVLYRSFNFYVMIFTKFYLIFCLSVWSRKLFPML